MAIASRGALKPPRALDREGVVAKRLFDPYTPDTVCRKIRNRAYTQMEGRRDLFQRP
jgi:hypothetical protein